MLRCVLRDSDLTDEEELDLEGYGIDSVIVVRSYELFYREVVDTVEKLNGKEAVVTYQSTNLVHTYLEPNFFS